VTNYRSSYGQFIREKGIDALIDELARKTASLENS
jgi:ABC-type transporter MlaC component